MGLFGFWVGFCWMFGWWLVWGLKIGYCDSFSQVIRLTKRSFPVWVMSAGEPGNPHSA